MAIRGGRRMKQYCRYCCACCYGDAVWCHIKKKTMSEEQAKKVNNCKEFVFNEIDVFDPNHKYKPRDNKEKNYEQLSLFEENKK